jgi:hypothetical protein
MVPAGAKIVGVQRDEFFLVPAGGVMLVIFHEDACKAGSVIASWPSGAVAVTLSKHARIESLVRRISE